MNRRGSVFTGEGIIFIYYGFEYRYHAILQTNRMRANPKLRRQGLLGPAIYRYYGGTFESISRTRCSRWSVNDERLMFGVAVVTHVHPIGMAFGHGKCLLG